MLSVKGLNKTYPGFRLEDVSFELPRGYIMGFIGRNGAGKSTTLKCVMNFVRPDSGEVDVLGMNMAEHELELKQRIAFLPGPVDYYTRTKLRKIAGVYKSFYDRWDEAVYQDYLKRFHLDEEKRVSELSAGMRVKFGLALALSHNAELILLDEPTSGLDPLARDELLDVLHDLVADGDRSILFSTHITSDLDKCADYVLFIRQGKIVSCKAKDDLIEEHVLVAGKKSDLTEQLSAELVGYKFNAFGFTGLAKRAFLKHAESLQTEKPNLEDIMIYYDREEK